ncbi:MAG: O-antigen ligase family protein [Chitinophagales bacterium]
MSISQIINRKNATLLAFAGLFFGLFYSRVVLSNAMILLAVVALLNRNFFQDFKHFLKRKELLLISGLFLIYAVSGIYSENQELFLTRLRVKIPFAFLPLVFVTLPKIEKPYLLGILGVFVLFNLSGMVYPLYSYFSDPELYNQLYRQGQVIPTPINHIRFSILLSIAHFVAAWLAYQYYCSSKTKWALTFAFAAVLIFAFLHLLSVRSGLLGLYFAWIFVIIYVFRKKWKYQIAALLIITVAVFTALQLSPTLKGKWNYMRYDLEKMFQGDEHTGYSDSGRIISILSGIEAGKKSPMIGVGMGDVKSAVIEVYDAKYPYIEEGERHTPHNQFVYIFTGLGLLGLLYFCLSIFVPVFQDYNYRFALFGVIQVIFLSSFMTEATLEGQIGTAAYLFFTLFCIKYKNTLQEKGE